MSIGIDRLARLLANLEAQKEQVESDITEVRARIIEEVGAGYVELDGQPYWKVTTRKTFKPQLAIENLDTEIIEAVSTPEVRSALLRKFDPALWEACTVESAPYLVRVSA